MGHNNDQKTCALCGKEGQHDSVTRHHYYPRPYKRGHRDDYDYICDTVHLWLHTTYTNEELARHYNDLESIRRLLIEKRINL
jgi:hypothetical protein